MSTRSFRILSRRLIPLLRDQQKRSASHFEKSSHLYDVVCVGGGPAGLSLATALKSSKPTSHLKIALVESQSLSSNARNQPPVGYSNRCSSLTPASVNFLDEIEAWKHADHTRIQPYYQMKVWDGVSGSRITFDWDSASRSSGNVGKRVVASMIENSNITSALVQRLKKLNDVTIFENSRVENIELGQDSEDLDLSSWPMLSLSNGNIIGARLLIGADGPNSLVRTFGGIESRGWDYEKQGVVATLRLHGEPFADGTATAYQRFLPTGPIALLPLPSGYASLVWSTTPSNARILKSLKAKDLVALINSAFRLTTVDLEYMHTISSGQMDEFEWRVKHTPFDRSLVPPPVADVQEGSVAAFPLRMRHADTYVGERIALVGDAAHTIHPLAGQGLNQGQADVQALVAVIEDAVLHGQDIGSLVSLEPYNAKRYAANNMLLGVVDKLHKLYSISSGPLIPLRSWGLAAVDSISPLKALLMTQAASTGRAI